MSKIKLRLQKLEAKVNRGIVEVVILRFTNNGEPLPAAHMSSNVKVSYQYADNDMIM